MVKPFSRVSLNVSPETKAILERLSVTQKKTKTDLLIKSIELLSSIYEANKIGGKVFIITQDNQQRELNFIQGN